MSRGNLVLDQGLAEMAELYGIHTARPLGSLSPTASVKTALEYMIPRERLLRKRARAEGLDIGTDITARTELGRLACAVAQMPLDPDLVRAPGYEACIEAEPRFMQTLAAIEGWKRRTRPNHVPATLYIDDSNVPFALKKNHGHRTILILRPSPVIPAVTPGMIVRGMSGVGRPFLGAADERVVPDRINPQLQIATVTEKHALAIVRPSVFSLSSDFVKASGYSPEDYMPNHRDFAREVARFSLARIIDRVDRIADSVRT